jgi:predicted amidohydrolase YtcJ
VKIFKKFPAHEVVTGKPFLWPGATVFIREGKMKKRVLITMAIILIFAMGTLTGCGSNKADTAWTNGVIYTADENDTFVEAVAVKDGKILVAGSNEEVEAYIGSKTVVTDLDGGFMMPGMTDSHLHAPGTMMTSLFEIDLNGILTEDKTMQTIKDYVAANPDMDVYYGSGFSIGAFSGQEIAKGPTKERLDAISDKPIIIMSYDGHTAWLNSAGFELCGVTKDTVPPKGGTIEKTANGELWGTMKELAQELIPAHEFTDAQFEQGYKAFIEAQTALGYVGLTDMTTGITAAPSKANILKDMDAAGELKMYVVQNTVMDPNKDIKPQIDAAAEKRANYGTETFKYTSLKFFADGVVEGVTGYLLEPYTAESGKTDFVSEPNWSPDKMKEAFDYALQNDFQIHVHSIGDAATRQTLDSLEYAQDKNEGKDFRNIITHNQLVADEDITRFGELNVIASVQPYWAFKEPYWWEIVDQPLLGTERAENEYPLQSFIDAGAVLVSSSDHPVTPVNNPFWAIEVGVTRNLENAEYYGVDDITDMDDPTWLLDKSERVSLENMIKSFTINGAYQNFRDDISGSIEVGKYADFAILDQNLFEINPLDIDKTLVLSTIFHGEVIYSAE